MPPPPRSPPWAVLSVLVFLLIGGTGPSVSGSGSGSSSRRHQASGTEPCKAASESELNSFLWTIKRDPPSYFFGTIHVPYTRVWDYIPDNTREAFDRAENVFFELDLTDPYTISQLANCQLLPQGEFLSDVLPKDLYRRLKRHLEYVKLMMPTWMTADQKGSGLYADYLFNAITGNWERKRPVWVMLMVNSLTEADIKSRGIPVLDLYLAQEAERLSKVTGAVERVDEQCVPLNELNFSQVLFALNQTLWQHENYRQGAGTYAYTTDDLIRHYNCGDLNMVIFSHDTAQVPNLVNHSLPPGELTFAKRIDEYFREKLIYKRNQRMANEVAHLLHTHPNRSFFFAFGAGHFLGNHTVIDNLVEQGFQVDHAGAEDAIFLGKDFVKKRRKKLPPPNYQVPPVGVGSYIDYLDPFFDHRRHRHRQRNHQRGRRKGRRRERVHATTDSYHLKQPQFNDLWVRLDATSFGPEAFFRQQPRPTQAPEPVQAMHSGSCVARLSLSPVITSTLCLLVTLLRLWDAVR